MKNQIIDLEEKDGVFEEKKEEAGQIEIDPDNVTFVFGFYHGGKQYIANTIVSDYNQLVPCVDWIKETIMKTLILEGILPEKSGENQAQEMVN